MLLLLTPVLEPLLRAWRRRGWLMKEEKLRIAIEKKLPALNERLRELTTEWEAAHAEQARDHLPPAETPSRG